MHAQKITVDDHHWQQIVNGDSFPMFVCGSSSSINETSQTNANDDTRPLLSPFITNDFDECPCESHDVCADDGSTSAIGDHSSCLSRNNLKAVVTEFVDLTKKSSTAYIKLEPQLLLSSFFDSVYYSKWRAREEGYIQGLLASSYESEYATQTSQSTLNHTLKSSSSWLSFFVHICHNLPIGIIIADARYTDIGSG
jgi:hypothetical protein